MREYPLMLNLVWLAIALLAVGLALYLLFPRKYKTVADVANSYDDWTKDGILEFYWGEHIHLGHYGSPPRRKNFLKAKADFVHEMVRWAGLDRLPPGTTVLDVGCGIGGSSRILARDYGFVVTGITISPQQVRRAQELTPPDLPVTFQVMMPWRCRFLMPVLMWCGRLKPVPTCRTRHNSPGSYCGC